MDPGLREAVIEVVFERGLFTDRRSLMLGISPRIIASMRSMETPGDQIESDLAFLADQAGPDQLRIWLTNIRARLFRPDQQAVLDRALASLGAPASAAPAPTPAVAPPPPSDPGPPGQALERLLGALFPNADELSRVLNRSLGPGFTAQLPSHDGPRDAYLFGVVRHAEARGEVPQLIDAVARERPNRAAELDAIRARFVKA